jgi:hypothetical protein
MKAPDENQELFCLTILKVQDEGLPERPKGSAEMQHQDLTILLNIDK